MKKFLTIAILALVCMAVFANGWEFAALVSPYGYHYSKGTTNGVSYTSETKYAVAFDLTADYWYDNGFFVGGGIGNGRTFYDDGYGDWGSFTLSGIAGYMFFENDRFSLGASMALGAEFDKPLETDLFEGINAFVMKAILECDYYICDECALVQFANYEVDFGSDKSTEQGFAIGFGISYVL